MEHIHHALLHESVPVSSDIAYDEQRQVELDRSVAAFNRWLDRANRLDVIERQPALFGWHAGREYSDAIHEAELMILRSALAEAERDRDIWIRNAQGGK